MPTLIIELPWPPSVNHIWRRWGHRTLLSKAGRVFYKATEPIIAVAMLEADVTTLTCPVALALGLHPPTRRVIDCDNRIKPAQDALKRGGLLLDDSQIYHVEATRLCVQPPGLCIATLTWEEET